MMPGGESENTNDTGQSALNPSPPAGANIPQLTLRTIVAGMFIGGVLSLCNIYSGLKIGFTTNMSIASALVAYGGFSAFQRWFGTRSFGLHENAMNQTTASAAASIAGAGLVAPIPALTMLTGQRMDFGWLVAWTLGVSLLGVLVGISVRRQMLLTYDLPFPYGAATATTMREMYSHGREATRRVRWLIGCGLGAGLCKALSEWLSAAVMWIPGRVQGAAPLGGISLKNLGFGFDPSVLMIGVGALIGMRSAASMLGGALLGWAILAPWIVERGFVESANLDANVMWFTELSNWMLWPGVALMVSSALSSFVLSIPKMLRRHESSLHPSDDPRLDVPRRAFWIAFAGVGAFACMLQVALFSIDWYAAVIAVGLAFALAIVAGRVAGETGIAPIGAMGKITQLTFALITPGNPTANLMAANVTGGSASQCADLLHDLKTGRLLGAWPRHQAVAQLFGVVSGALMGSAGYIFLVPDPSATLLTQEWPAPAVAQWKAVAEVFTRGVSHLPQGSGAAAAIAVFVGIALSFAESKLPPDRRRFVPNPSGIGLALVIPAYYSISVFIGAALLWLGQRKATRFTKRFGVVIAAGLIAGESLVGVVFAIARLLGE